MLLALALPACGAPGPPSIVLVTLDTVRRDHLGAYGSRRGLTPRLDALAAGGLVHDAAYTTMPATGPAHLSLFTGLQPASHGARRNGEALPPALADRELGAILRERGYATAAFVTSVVVGPAQTGLAGFDVYDVPKGPLRGGSHAVSTALEWLDGESHRPVFLWVHLFDAHAPYGTLVEKRLAWPVDKRHYGYVPRELYAQPAEQRKMAERYARGVRDADASVGELVAGVRARLDPDPLVLVVGDHGESLGEHLGTRSYAYDHGEYLDPECIAIPLILAGPGVAPGRSGGAVSIRDVYDTILAATDTAPATAEASPDASAPRAATPRDLRASSDARRVVVIERRAFVLDPPDSVRRHAAAASDGTSLAIVGEDGRDTLLEGPSAFELGEVARFLALAATGTPQEVPEETRALLEELGYTD